MLTYVYDLIKDCPIGTEFYVTGFGKCFLAEIKPITSCEKPIVVHIKSFDDLIDLAFTADGKFNGNTEQINYYLWPDEKCRSWKEFEQKFFNV